MCNLASMKGRYGSECLYRVDPVGKLDKKRSDAFLLEIKISCTPRSTWHAGLPVALLITIVSKRLPAYINF